MTGSCPSPRLWSFEEAIGTLRGALRFGTNPSLDCIRALCAALGDPQAAYASIQVTGTNGKTSTARFIEAPLRGEGLATGLYTSPDLQRYPERIEIGGEVVSDEEFARAVGVAADSAAALAGDGGGCSQPTEFELLTAAALWLFRERGVEAAVLEVGMGGRWDATSVVRPRVAVITGVGLDHMHILGDTIEKIAAEKAAIIKPGSTAVLGPGTVGVESPFVAQAQAEGAPLWVVHDIASPRPSVGDATATYSVDAIPSTPGGATTLSVRGVLGDYPSLRLMAPSYQAPNVATAVAAAEAFLGHALDAARAAAALSACRLPGRFELVSAEPPVVVDGAHNPQAAEALALAVAEAWPDPRRRPALLLGVLADKDAAGIVRALAPAVAEIAVTASASPRAMPPEQVAEVVAEVTGRRPAVYSTVAEALQTLAAHAPDGIVASGSITVAGEARSIFCA